MTFQEHALPQPGDYADYYDKYISHIRGTDISQTLPEQAEHARRLFGQISESNGNYRYAEGKWSVKSLLQHIVDTERVMAYRALTFSRENGAVLPGFDQDPWEVTAEADRRTIAEILDEFASVRHSTVHLFASFSAEHWSTAGIASAFQVKTCALPYIIAGHYAHHADILQSRYTEVLQHHTNPMKPHES